MNSIAFLRIYIPGGVMSRDELMDIVTLAKKFRIRDIQLGLRQDINIPVDRHYMDDIKLYLDNLNFDYEFNSRLGRNIVTSYAANGILESETWLTEGAYLDILDLFEHKPQLRINIVDPNQGLIPLITGDLNFIASKTNNYWYLRMDLPDWFSEITDWPGLIYSDDISKVAETIEEMYLAKEKTTLNNLFAHINDILHGSNRREENQLSLTPHRLPYYEGFNKVGNKYWLGIYKRTYMFPIDFVEGIADLCAQTNRNKICLTPWRSFLIKGIKEKYWQSWVNLLGLHSINIRHSSLEMNWRVPDFDKEALEIKKYLVKEFDKMDIRNYGLTFAIRNLYWSELDAIVVIKKVKVKSMFKTKQFATNYNIYHTVGFKPNTKDYITYSTDVTYSSLPQLLQKLTKKFYEYKSRPNKEEETQRVERKKEIYIIYQCKNCLTTYDQQYGDSINFVEAGTTFDKIPNSFTCPVCDAPKSAFEPIQDDISVV